MAPLLDFSNNLGDGPLRLGGDYLGDDYGLFGCDVAFCEFFGAQFFVQKSPNKFSFIFLNWPHRKVAL